VLITDEIAAITIQQLLKAGPEPAANE